MKPLDTRTLGPIRIEAGKHDALIEAVGQAIEDAWNGSGSEGQANALPPIDLTPRERRYLARAALKAIP